MNKAFVREPDPSDTLHCPQCGSLGVLVPPATLDAQIQPAKRSQLGATAYYCPFADCKTAYFDAFERSIGVDECVSPLYPKALDAPICACFGFSREEIEADLHEGVVTRTRAAVARAKESTRECIARSATGQSCVAEIQRYYMRRQQELRR